MTKKYALQTNGISQSALPSLDLIQNNRNRFCGNFSVKRREEALGQWEYARLSCKRWVCKRCGPKRARQLRRAIIACATDRDLSRFLTLTLDPRICTAKESVTHIRKSWNKFRTYLKRRYGKSISFISIIEPQKNGYAHLHILVDRYIPQAWISEAWQAVGGGRIAHIKQVDIHRIAVYLSKYLTKDILLAIVHKKYRRYTCSRDIVLFVKKKVGALWELISKPIEDFYLKARIRGLIEEKRDSEGLIQWFAVKESI